MVNPRLLIFCGPSGSGKSTLCKRLLQDFPEKFGFSVSHTTRKPRSGEMNGRDYHFVNFQKMQDDIAQGLFIESATFSGNAYGTSKAAIEAVCKAGRVCLLDIDVQGVKQVKQTSLCPWYIFVKPPSLKSLEERLCARNSETEESLKQRLQVAHKEMEYGESPGNFDLIIINDDLDHAYKQLKEFVEENVLETQN